MMVNAIFDGYGAKLAQHVDKARDGGLKHERPKLRRGGGETVGAVLPAD